MRQNNRSETQVSARHPKGRLRPHCGKQAVVLVTGLLIVEGNAHRAFGQTDAAPGRDEVLGLLRDRAENVATVKMTWTEECFDAKGALVTPDLSAMSQAMNPDGLTIPPEDVTYNNESTLFLDRDKTRFESVGQYPQENGLVSRDVKETFDGQTRRVFKEPTQKRSHPLGRIYPQKAGNKLLTMLSLEPPLYCYRLNHPRMQLFPLDDYRLENSDIPVNGRTCVVLAHRTERHSQLIWLDPARGYTILRLTRLAGESVSQQTDFRWDAHSEIGWVLKGWTTTKHDRQGKLLTSIDANVTGSEFNQPIAHSEFVLQFPANTYVDDLSTGEATNYILRPDGTKRMVTIGERRRGATYSELLSTESGEAAQPPGRRRFSTALIVVNGLLLVVFVIWRFLGPGRQQRAS